MLKPVNHFLDLKHLDQETITKLLAQSLMHKQTRHSTHLHQKSVAIMFELPSTRTRLSFELAVKEMGGHALIIDAKNTQIGRDETWEDTAKVFSLYTNALVLRTNDHNKLSTLTQTADIPIINALSNLGHPCQVFTDIFTLWELKGELKGKIITWLGDINNMTYSWIEAATILECHLRIASPYLTQDLPQSDWVTYYQDPIQAATKADCIMTDTWVSMGQDDYNTQIKKQQLMPFQVNSNLLNHAKDDVIFLHCLPAHREEEVTSDVMDGRHSYVWQQAMNRLPCQKAILLWSLGL